MPSKAVYCKTATHCIRLGIRSAKNDFLQKVASGHQTSAKASDLLPNLKAAGIGRKFQKPFRCELPLLLDDEGKPTATQADRDDVWLKFFGRQELGVTKSISEIIATPQQPVLIDEELNWSAEVLPSILEVEAALRRTPARKSPGLDGIPGEFLRTSASVARAVHPLMLKSTMLLRQPLQWRGGVLHAAWKGGGNRAKADTHRSLFVSSLLGKALHRLCKTKATGITESVLHGLHLGSKKGCPVVFPAMYILDTSGGLLCPEAIQPRSSSSTPQPLTTGWQESLLWGGCTMMKESRMCSRPSTSRLKP